MKVQPTPDGNILLSTIGTKPRQYIPFKPTVFRELNGQNTAVFKQDEANEKIYLFLSAAPEIASIKLTWVETPFFHLVVLVITILSFISTVFWPLGTLRRKICRRNPVYSPAPKYARGIAGLMSGLFILFLVGFVAVMSDYEKFLFGIPLLLKILLILPLIAAVCTLGVLFFMISAWIRHYWDICSRIHYTFVFIAAFVFFWFLNCWNLLGFHF